MEKVRISEGRIVDCVNSEDSIFIYEGINYDIVVNDFLPIGGEHFILDSGYAFETV